MTAEARRVLGLRELLREPEPAAPVSGGEAPAAAAVDPEQAAEALRRKIFDEAREAGYAAGQAVAKTELDRRVAEATAAVEQRHAARERELAAARDALLALAEGIEAQVASFEARLVPAASTLAMAAVARIVGDGWADGRAVEALCRQALADVRQRPVTLRLSPADLPAVEALQWPADVRLEADDALPRGGCRLESHRGVYESGLATRLHAIADALGGAGDA